jgi:hypothetical protein
MRRWWWLVWALAACMPDAGSQANPSLGSEPDAPGVCEECLCRSIECGADAAPAPCPECDPATENHCESGCCGKLRDDYGNPILLSDGGTVYGCTFTPCLTDEQCGGGMTCAAGESCDQNRCLCPDGHGPWEEDWEYPCCRARNLNGVCCRSDLVEPESGLCICYDANMYDDGEGCACPPGLEPDPTSGVCRCGMEGAIPGSETGSCDCPEGTHVALDDYTGTSRCADDGEPPPTCRDENAEYDPITGECPCKPGYAPTPVEGYATQFCEPSGGDAGPDAGLGSPPDAGAVPDAPVTPGGDAGPVPVHDAGGIIVRDAR